MVAVHTCDKASKTASVLPRGVVSHSWARFLVASASGGRGMTAVMGCPEALSTARTARLRETLSESESER